MAWMACCEKGNLGTLRVHVEEVYVTISVHAFIIHGYLFFFFTMASWRVHKVGVIYIMDLEVIPYYFNP